MTTISPTPKPVMPDLANLRKPSRNQIIAAVAIITVFFTLGLRSLVPLVLLPSAAAVFAYRRSRHRRWAEHDAQREAITGLCTALRAELEAGLQPRAAFTSAVWSYPELRDLAERVSRPEADLDLPALLTEYAHHPGRRALRSIAACWYAADRHGIALADAITGIEEGLRAESARLRATQLELAGIRATILLLAALPLFGFALGLALGADPLDTLLHTAYGQLSLLLGVALDLAGLLWTDHLVATLRPEATKSTGQARPRSLLRLPSRLPG
jgi:tight adherence protein B